ncbi:MAG: ABC transporter ATP-binding protein [Chloroflexi bacterium]|nr:ABC transporter ATP-binding protein [Chloroflexota bacterium]
MAEALRIENLVVRFQTQLGQVNALNGVSLAMEEGQVYCLVGESGSGKSTLALAIMGLLPHNATIEKGAIYFDGVNLLGSGPKHMQNLRGKDIAMVFQDAQSALNPVQLVGDQLEEVVLTHTNISARIANKMAQEMLREMGLADPRHVMGQYPFHLSGGMCQRVMMAIGLILEPRLLIADEPTSGLDVTLQADILDLLRKLCREQHATILLITHDMGVVATMAQKVGVLYAGSIYETAEVVPTFKRPQHPYTWSLIRSLPRLDQPDKRLQALPGSPPDMMNLPDECAFLPRCHKALSQCRASPRPPLRELEPGHHVACYNPVLPQD